MKTSIEITLMPLNDNYKEIIKNFIKSIRIRFEILENPLSTQIYVVWSNNGNAYSN